MQKVLTDAAGNVLPPVLSDSIKPSSGVIKTSCQTNKDYWEKNKRACKDKDWYYNHSGKRSNDKHDEDCKRWKNGNIEKYRKNCKDALDDFFANYEDAELIYDILTAGRDDEDENIKDCDSMDDLDGTQDE